MTNHSVNEYMGTTLINGVLCHRWLNGRFLPVFLGASDDDGDDGDSDGDDSGDDGDDDGDEEGEKKPAAKDGDEPPTRLERENAKYRVRAKERTAERDTAIGERDAAIAERDAARAELDKLKKDGVTDETTKTRLADLESENATVKTENADLKSRLDKVNEEKAASALEATVAAALTDQKIDCEPDVAISRLRKNGIVPDEDGDYEDLDGTLKKLLKKGVFKKVASGDEDDNDATDGASGATRSGRPVTNRNGKSKDKYNKAALAKKYPALRGRV